MNAARAGAPRAAVLVAAAASLLLAPPTARAVSQVTAENVEVVPIASSAIAVDVWVNREEGGVYRPGESMRIFFRTRTDAYVLVYNIDTEGYIHLVYPYGPSDPHRVEAGRTYRIPARHDPYDLVADGPPGMEFVVAVASHHPFRDLPWFLRGGDPDEALSDDELESGQIVGDPYVGMERLNQRIIAPEHLEDSDITETFFYIHQRVEYPRYVCADCHYAAYPFDPYLSHCSVVDIRIDATWVRYARPRVGVVRPRYYYYVRPGAPDRYAEWKNRRYSSLDGSTTLRSRFVVARSERVVRDRQSTQKRQLPPEFEELRRPRPGRLWQGRDEIIRLRERVPDVGSKKGRSGDSRSKQGEPRVTPRSVREREREKPSNPPQSEKRGRSREPDDAAKERDSRRDDSGRREEQNRREENRREDQNRREESRAREEQNRGREDSGRKGSDEPRKGADRRDPDESRVRERRSEPERGSDRGRGSGRGEERSGSERDHGRGRSRG